MNDSSTKLSVVDSIQLILFIKYKLNYLNKTASIKLKTIQLESNQKKKTLKKIKLMNDDF